MSKRVKKLQNISNLLNQVYFGDCLKTMDSLPNGCIDMILCDLPYGKTKNKWDSIIPFDLLWKSYERIIKENGAIVLFGQDKFSAKLMLSNEKLHRYNLIWEKTTATGFLNSKKMPLRTHEDILVFYKKLPTYNPQKTTGHPRKVSSAKNRSAGILRVNSLNDYTYGKQYPEKIANYDSTERFPRSVLKFSTDKQKIAFHPTQKPISLCEYLIKTYTNSGELVLDNCAGSGTTGVACRNINRYYILMEKEPKYYDYIVKRLKS